MQRIVSSAGVTVSFDRYGQGPPLVLVHGGFSDHVSNWSYVKPILQEHFTVYAIARRGRGETDATTGHSTEDEMDDLDCLLRSVGSPVILLGHSYGGRVALGAAARSPSAVRRLILYEPPHAGTVPPTLVSRLEELAEGGEWEALIFTFFHQVTGTSLAELEALRGSPDWPPILADARATLGDLRALTRHRFDPEQYRGVAMPVLLQIGEESARERYATDALAAVLPDARIASLPGQAHEGMTTAPELYAESVVRFLLDRP